MNMLKLNSSRIAHTSNPFHSALQAIKGVFNICWGQTDYMEYL